MLKTRKELMAENADCGPEPTFTCTLCWATGWLGTIKHKKNCLLADRDVVAVELKAVIDPALVCTKCYGRGRRRHWIGVESEVRVCDRCKGTGKSKAVT